MSTTIKHCERCGDQFELPELPDTGNIFFKAFSKMLEGARFCDDCEPIAWEAHKPKPHRRSWAAVCPPLYRDTDPKRLDQAALGKVMGWKFSARGVGLLGESGTGKTRMLYLLLKREHAAGRSVAAVTGTEFAHKVADLERRRHHIEDFIDAGILFLDDIDKAKFTDRVESDLMHVIEERTKRKRPIVFAVNADGDGLTQMLSENRAEPIVRRLREFCDVWIADQVLADTA